MYRLALVVLATSACSFQAGVTQTPSDDEAPLPDAGPDGGPDADHDDDAGPPDAEPDAMPEPLDDIDHVAAADEMIGTADLTIGSAITIDTESMSFGMALPQGVTFTTAAQDGGGPELAILRVRDLTVGASVRAVGTRPLVILAETIMVSSQIDVGGRNGEPGAGGHLAGPGKGGDGAHIQTYPDGGAGGGGHGTQGATGGDTPCAIECNPNTTVQGAAPGPAYNPGLARLNGGSGGGWSWFTSQQTQCERKSPGAGGGAIQLYARTSIVIGAPINAGGGGGLGGDQCQDPYNFYAGHGGGSGGAIYLQAPTVTNNSTLAANGGGGGAGGGNGGDGGNGANATGLAVASGGNANGTYSARGGNGATGSAAAQAGDNAIDQGNGGGGGGGVGQIVIRYKTAVTAGTTSPAVATSMY